MLKHFIITYILLSIIFSFIMLFSISFLTLWERKLLGGIQRRHGPVYTGYLGLLQPFADGLKLIFKTFNFPSGGYYHIFLGSSIFSLTLSLAPWALLPFNEFFVFSDINCSLLLILLLSSINKYTILFSGWSSNSKYGVLGSIRSGAQMASYEIPLLLSLLPIILFSSNLNFLNLIYFQVNFFWFIFIFPNAFIFFVCLLAETNRAPFDLPEAESELVAGYNMEYSSLSFAVFFLAEYNHLIVASFLFSLLFLGGWDCLGLFNINWIIQTFFLIIKTLIIINLIIYVRGVLPRYKFTDLITMCWQVFIPITTIVFFFFWLLSLINNILAQIIYNIDLYFIFFLYFFYEISLFFENIDIIKFFDISFLEYENLNDIDAINEEDFISQDDCIHMSSEFEEELEYNIFKNELESEDYISDNDILENEPDYVDNDNIVLENEFILSEIDNLAYKKYLQWFEKNNLFLFDTNKDEFLYWRTVYIILFMSIAVFVVSYL